MSVGSVRNERVEAALRSAAEATGVDFGYLLRTAKRESSLDPAAKARTSSAAGLFQFIEQTWLGTLKKHGVKHGYGQLSAQIERGPGGRLTVADPEARQKVLDLRYDVRAASLMGAELASDHAAYLRGRTGRDPTGGDLYVAHFLGPANAARLIEAASRTPDAKAAALFPAAAGANRSIFYDKGRPATVGEVYADLTRTRGVAPAVAAREASPAPVRAATPEPVAPKVDRPRAAHPLQALMARAERARRESLLVDMVLGEGRSAGFGAAPFSAELLTLLSAARDR